MDVKGVEDGNTPLLQSQDNMDPYVDQDTSAEANEQDMPVEANEPVNIGSPLLPMGEAPPKAPTGIVASLNTAEWWNVWLGFLVFVVVAIVSVCNVEIPIIATWIDGSTLADSFTPQGIGRLIVLIVGTEACLALCYVCMKQSLSLRGFPWMNYLYLCFVTLLSFIVGGWKTFHDNGLGSSVWCIIFGFLFRNIFPSTESSYKASKAHDVEFFIKVSLVLLAVDMTQIADTGPRGLLVSWLDTVILLVVLNLVGMYIFKMPHEQSLITVAGVSICGSSAAVAVAELFPAAENKVFANSVITIMSIMTIPHIPIMPLFASHVGLDPTLTGAWIGGCVDSTGAVVATATLGGIKVLQTSVIIKMIQNILISPVCLFITWRHVSGAVMKGRDSTLVFMWKKFPKFVLGFVITAIVTTCLESSLRALVVTNSFSVSEWFSALSFVRIGAEIDITTAKSEFYQNRKMVALYSIGQFIDIFSTFGFARAVFH